MEILADIQYILDERGNKTAAIVPISIWESMTHMETENQNELRRKKIESFFGVLKNSQVIDEIERYSHHTREEAVERI